MIILHDIAKEESNLSPKMPTRGPKTEPTRVVNWHLNNPIFNNIQIFAASG
jgi:hypothetical protein